MKSSIKNYGLKILKILVFFWGQFIFFLVIKSMKKYLILITT